jgi:hypothetical protein
VIDESESDRGQVLLIGGEDDGGVTMAEGVTTTATPAGDDERAAARRKDATRKAAERKANREAEAADTQARATALSAQRVRKAPESFNPMDDPGVKQIRKNSASRDVSRVNTKRALSQAGLDPMKVKQPKHRHATADWVVDQIQKLGDAHQ